MTRCDAGGDAFLRIQPVHERGVRLTAEEMQQYTSFLAVEIILSGVIIWVWEIV